MDMRIVISLVTELVCGTELHKRTVSNVDTLNEATHVQSNDDDYRFKSWHYCDYSSVLCRTIDAGTVGD
jgi:hypothetical protein